VCSPSKGMNNRNAELEKTVERLKKINEIGRMLSSTVETRELMKIIVRTTSELLEAERVVMHLKESRKPAMTIACERGDDIRQLPSFPMETDRDYEELFVYGRPVFIQGNKGPEGNGRKGSRIGMPLRVKGVVIGAILLENGAAQTAFTEDERELLTTLANQAMAAIENASLYESLKNSYFSTVQSLVNALEANDRFTKGHSERVRMLSAELGEQLGLDFHELELLQQAAILHDIGKIGIDHFILQKQGRLTGKEYSLVKTHPLIGDEILGPIETLEEVRKTIIQHHERHDGSGYPYGLKDEEISLKAKILSVVDTFDAMMTDRPYRKALSVSAVMEELSANAGTQFDPSVVATFVRMLEASGDEFLSAAGYNILFSPY
jgi:putative nucleotidyltransferase with HDIG domain